MEYAFYTSYRGTPTILWRRPTVRTVDTAMSLIRDILPSSAHNSPDPRVTAVHSMIEKARLLAHSGEWLQSLPLSKCGLGYVPYDLTFGTSSSHRPWWRVQRCRGLHTTGFVYCCYFLINLSTHLSHHPSSRHPSLLHSFTPGSKPTFWTNHSHFSFTYWTRPDLLRSSFYFQFHILFFVYFVYRRSYRSIGPSPSLRLPFSSSGKSSAVRRSSSWLTCWIFDVRQTTCSRRWRQHLAGAWHSQPTCVVWWTRDQDGDALA